MFPVESAEGGGVGILLRRGFDVAVNDSGSYQSFEITDVTISNGPSSIRLLTIYRPPPSTENKLTVKLFFDEFSSMITPSNTPLVIAGYFNFHKEDLDDRDAMTMRDFLESCYFHQHVEEPTHRKSHTLDLIITRTTDRVVSAVKVDHRQALPSDHSVIRCVLNISRPKATKQVVCFRKLKTIDVEAFKSDIAASPLVTAPADDIGTLSTQFDDVFGNLLDQHAPMNSKSITLRPHAP